MKNVKQVQELSLEELELVNGAFVAPGEDVVDYDPVTHDRGGIGWTPSGGNYGRGA